MDSVLLRTNKVSDQKSADAQILIRPSSKEDVRLAVEAKKLIDSAASKYEIAKRSQEYLADIISSGLAVLAFSGNKLIGFSYIRKWSDNFVSHSALVVCDQYHGLGIGKKIKHKMMELSSALFPEAEIFSLTTNPKVRKMNLDLGFVVVSATDITKDPEFWEACRGCKEFESVNGSSFEGQVTPCKFKCCCAALLFRNK